MIYKIITKSQSYTRIDIISFLCVQKRRSISICLHANRCQLEDICIQYTPRPPTAPPLIYNTHTHTRAHTHTQTHGTHIIHNTHTRTHTQTTRTHKQTNIHIKTLFNIVEDRFLNSVELCCKCCIMMFRWVNKQPGIHKFEN